MAFQIKQPCDKPQGILNIGTMVLCSDDFVVQLVMLRPNDLAMTANHALQS